jgi:hypothetical protein
MYRTIHLGILAAALGAGLWSFAPGPSAASERSDGNPRPAQRQAIRQTPILERPNRVGHFYGNTVRRLNGVTNPPAGRG